MKLQLRDIDSFIEKTKIREVTSIKIYTGGGRTEIDPKGQFSEEIFGRLGSQQRKKQFGWVKLNCTVIHPEAYPVLTSIDTDLTKLILRKTKYIIDNQGKLIESEDPEAGSGILFFITNFDKINFDLFKDKKEEEVNFIKKNKDKIFINKYILLPAGVRDLQLDRKSGKTIISLSEITTLYERLIRQSNAIGNDIILLDPEIADPIIEKIQRTLIDINGWIKDRMRGKFGLIRGSMLKKVTDYSGRMVITPDPTLPLGFVGLPWHVILKLLEPFAINQILYKDRTALTLIQMYLNMSNEIDINDLRRFFAKVNEEPESVNEQLKSYLINVAKIITNDRVIIYKRDPVVNRDNYLSCYVRVDPSGFSMKINPYDCVKHTGDFDGDAVSIFSLLTQEAQEEAKKNLNPIHGKPVWQPVGNYNRAAFEMTLDAAMAIYSATKD